MNGTVPGSNEGTKWKKRGKDIGEIQRYLIARLESLDFVLLTFRHAGCKLWACLELDHLGSDSGSANFYLCNLGQIMKPLCASVSSSMKWKE